MEELNQILEREKALRERLKKIKLQAQREIEAREAELTATLDQELLEKEFLEKVEKEKAEKKKKITEAIQRETQQKIFELNQKAQKNFGRALAYLIKEICK